MATVYRGDIPPAESPSLPIKDREWFKQAVPNVASKEFQNAGFNIDASVKVESEVENISPLTVLSDSSNLLFGVVDGGKGKGSIAVANAIAGRIKDSWKKARTKMETVTEFNAHLRMHHLVSRAYGVGKNALALLADSPVPGPVEARVEDTATSIAGFFINEHKGPGAVIAHQGNAKLLIREPGLKTRPVLRKHTRNFHPKAGAPNVVVIPSIPKNSRIMIGSNSAMTKPDGTPVTEKEYDWAMDAATPAETADRIFKLTAKEEPYDRALVVADIKAAAPIPQPQPKANKLSYGERINERLQRLRTTLGGAALSLYARGTDAIGKAVSYYEDADKSKKQKIMAGVLGGTALAAIGVAAAKGWLPGLHDHATDLAPKGHSTAPQDYALPKNRVPDSWATLKPASSPGSVSHHAHHLQSIHLQPGQNPSLIAEHQLQTHGYPHPSYQRIMQYEDMMLHQSGYDSTDARNLAVGTELKLPKVK